MGDRFDVRGDVGRRGLRVLHRRRVQQDDRRLARAGHMRTPMVLDAIEMARWNRGLRHEGLRCHSDAGSQFTSIRYGERLAEIGATPSIGSVGDSFDNALAETVNGYYKAELIRGPARTGPWKTVEDVELATLGWVPLAQQPTTSRLPRRHAPIRVRNEVLRYPPGRPDPGSLTKRQSLHQTQHDSLRCAEDAGDGFGAVG